MPIFNSVLQLNHAFYSVISEPRHIYYSTEFNECSIERDGEYRTFDKLKYDFEGEHSYVLVQTKNLPNNLPDVYIEGINEHSIYDDDDDDDDGDDDDDSEEHEADHILQELKIRVYNHTVEFKKKLRLVVSTDGIFHNILPPSNFSVAPLWSKQYYVHGILSYF